MNKILPAAGLAALVLAATACSSSSSSTHATGSSSATHAATTGTESMTGQVTGAAAVTGTNGPTVPLTLTGPVATTSAFTPPGGTSTHSVVTFKTPDGNLVVAAVAPGANQNPALNAKTCAMAQTIHATYVVNGAKSTGKFAGATGKGTATFSFAATAPKLASGKCNDSENAQPLAKGAIVIFTASGPLTLKS